jgi:hypothetical protein
MGLFSVSEACIAVIHRQWLPFRMRHAITDDHHPVPIELVLTFATHVLQMLATMAATFLALLAFRILVLGET